MRRWSLRPGASTLFAPGSVGRRRSLFTRLILGLCLGFCPMAPAGAQVATRPDPPKVALVLSGGGAMGIAHVGAILEMERLGFRPDMIVGTSMGSIVGGLYASGMSGEELKHAVESMDWDAIFDTTPPREGLTFRQKQQEAEFPVKPSVGVVKGKPSLPSALVSDANLLLQLRRLLGARAAVPTFDDLPIPYRAVATDIETGQKVVLDRGDLARAMRASMSVPGVFAPQRLNGKLLVDGGMADNVPIDVAREMGADIVIVVATQGPLTKAEDIQSLPQVLGQTVALLILANERQQLSTVKPTDVLITVDTHGLSSADFKKARELIAAGRESTVAKEADIRRVASRRGFHTAAASEIHPPPRIDYVRVQNSSQLSDQVLLRYVQPFVGRPLDSEALIKALQRMRGQGGFTRVDYRIEEREGRTGLVIDAEQRPGDTRRLRPGLTIAGGGSGRTEFDVSLEYRLLHLDANGSEARLAATLGTRNEFTAEYFKLLDSGQKWFVEPSIQLRKRPVAVYDSTGFRLGEYDAVYGLGGLAVGRQFGSVGEFRIGVEAGAGKASLQEGSIIPRDIDIQTGQLYARAGVDTLDSPYFPTRGGRLLAGYTAGLSALGEEDDFQQLAAKGAYALSSGRNALLLFAEGGDTFQGPAPLPSLFALGGPFSFPGYSVDELTGQAYFAARAMYRYKLTSNADSLFGLPVYLGATVVTGNAWASSGDVDFSSLRVGGNIYVATDTIFGPVFLAFGAAERGRTAFYLFVGKPF
jgi:NTE family protein